MVSVSDTHAPQLAGRDKLLDGAIKSIAELGLQQTTVRTIADFAGVTPGLVRHHFGGKDNLLAEVHQWLNDRVLAKIDAAMATSQSNLGLAVQELFLAYFPTDSDDQINMRVLVTFWSAALSEEETAQLQRDCYARMDDLLGRFVQESLPPVDSPELLAESLAAMMKGFWFRCYTEPERMTSARVLAAAQQFTTFVVNSVPAQE